MISKKASAINFGGTKMVLEEHFRQTETERGLLNPLFYDLNYKQVAALRLMGYKESVVGRPFRETDRVFVAFFIGVKKGCFLIHSTDLYDFLKFTIKNHAAFTIVKMRTKNYEDALYINKSNQAFVYDRKLLVFLDSHTIESLAIKFRLIPNPYTLTILENIYLSQKLNTKEFDHIISIEKLMHINLFNNLGQQFGSTIIS